MLRRVGAKCVPRRFAHHGQQAGPHRFRRHRNRGVCRRATTEQPQFVAIVEAKTQPDEQRWLKYALPLVEHQKNLAKGLAMGLRSALAQGTPIAEREEEIKMLLNMVATS